jgi:hypothetical protein
MSDPTQDGREPTELISGPPHTHCHYCHSAMYGIGYVTEIPALAMTSNGIEPVPYKVPCCKGCHERHERDARNAKAASKLTVVRSGQRGPA